eukprot:COSAG01_NODE_8577_length_2734_cov_1.447818_1_plen_306_part_00
MAQEMMAQERLLCAPEGFEMTRAMMAPRAMMAVAQSAMAPMTMALDDDDSESDGDGCEWDEECDEGFCAEPEPESLSPPGGPPPPAPGGPPSAEAKKSKKKKSSRRLSADALEDADVAMDDALVRASSLDSLDRQSSNSASSTAAAAVDGSAREAYLKPIRTALQTSVTSGYAAFLDHKATYGSSPSFYLYSAQTFRQAGAPPSLCLKIATNVVEKFLCNAQTCRVVAYFVLSLGLSDLAVAAFENVITLAPEEPQSQTDLAFARFFRLRETLGTIRERKLSVDATQQAQVELQGIITLLVFVGA